MSGKPILQAAFLSFAQGSFRSSRKADESSRSLCSQTSPLAPTPLNRIPEAAIFIARQLYAGLFSYSCF